MDSCRLAAGSDRLTGRRMTVWILLTLALGAITGTAEAPLLRAHCAKPAAQSSVIAAQRIIRKSTVQTRRIRSDRAAALTALRDAFRLEAPLTGAAAPRAPAANC